MAAPPTAPTAAATAARIYMGGLTPDVTPADVINRMRPFGEVLQCELIPSKQAAGGSNSGSSNGAVVAAATCRGFAYVTLVPKDAVSLSRMFSLYNGCKWRGQKLRVELAQPHYLARLQQEAQEEAAAAEQAEQERAEQEQQQHQPLAVSADDDGDAHVLRLPVPGSKRKHLAVDLTAKHKSHRTWFPAAREKRLAELSWEPLGASKRVALQAAADAADSLPRAPKQQLQQHQPVEQQRQQLHTTSITSSAAPAGHGGATVPFVYASQPPHHQQQQQQQQQPAAKGSAKIVAQELVGQLKLLKHITDKARQHQHQQRRGRAAPGVVDFSDAVVPGGDDPGAAAASLDRFADSDSEGEQHAARAPASGVLVPVVKQQQPQQQQARKQVHPQQQQQQQQTATDGDDDDAGDDDSPALSASSDLDSDYGSDEWQQWLAAEGIADDEVQPAVSKQQMQPQPQQPQQQPRTAQQQQPARQPSQRAQEQQRAPPKQAPKQRTVELLVPCSARLAGAADLDRFASDSE